MYGNAHRFARVAWLLAYLAILGAPYLIEWRVAHVSIGEGLQMSATNTGLVALSMLVVAYVLIGRLPSLLSSFGIERVLRMHRVAAVFVVVLVALHVGFVVVSDPRGLSIFDLAHTTWAARAAVTSTLALVATIALAMRRRRRQPRYEGWRLLHVALAVIVLLTAYLHVVWLDHLDSHWVFAVWFGLMGLVVTVVIGRRWVWLPLRARRRSYVVEEVTAVAKDTVNVEVKARGHRSLSFHAGQFAWLKIGASSFVFEEHPFTIASSAETPRRKEFAVKALGDFSELLRGLRPGRPVYLDGPYGGMTIDGLDSSWGFVFIAGGIGVTPMLSMLRTLADREDRRSHLLLLGARSLDDVVLRPEIEHLPERLSLDVVYALQHPPPGWRGERGRIDGAMLDRWLPHHGRHSFDYFLCGPPEMVSTVNVQLLNRGVPAGRIHTERFEVV